MLNDVGSIASIVALGITVWVAVEVRRLHRFYRRHIILPKLVTDLARHLRSARTALDQKRVDDAKRAFGKCDALIERVSPFGDTKVHDRSEAARQAIDSIIKQRTSLILAKGYNVLNEIDALLESARAYIGEDKWSQRT